MERAKTEIGVNLTNSIASFKVVASPHLLLASLTMMLCFRAL